MPAFKLPWFLIICYFQFGNLEFGGDSVSSPRKKEVGINKFYAFVEFSLGMKGSFFYVFIRNFLHLSQS